MVRPRNYCARKPRKGERCQQRACPYWTPETASHCLRKDKKSANVNEEIETRDVLIMFMNILSRKEEERDLRGSKARSSRRTNTKITWSEKKRQEMDLPFS